MIPPPTESPPFDGELYSEDWWQRVAPQLTPDGRAVVQKTLMEAADRLGEADRERFEAALRALQTPTPEQLAFLRSPKHPTAQNQLLHNGQLDLSKILICHPESGEAIDWRDCQLQPITFKKAVFAGKANFQVAKFMGEATFEKATFAGEANFWKASFESYASFRAAQFAGTTSFNSTNFAESAHFDRAKFEGEASFQYAKFAGNAHFWGAQFAGETDFQRATFAGESDFWKARFEGEAIFQEVTFEKLAKFQAMTFTGNTNFLIAEFAEQAIFEEATFKGVANFHAARFGKTVSFRGSNWGAVPDFVGTAFKDEVAIADFTELQIFLTNNNITVNDNPEAISSFKPASICNRMQALRKMARDADDRPRELDYFALELQSRYKGAGLAEWAKRRMVRLYGLFSDYGRGIGRPFWWLMGLLAVSAMGYALAAKNTPSLDTRFESAITLSFVNALPALGVTNQARDLSLLALYGKEVPVWVYFIGIGEGGLALILLFLIALGLGNRFRL
jgi:uncharacterized protein YjbI with pentapeptide repeats